MPSDVGEGVIQQASDAIMSDAITRYTSVLGVLNNIRRTIPLLSRTHKEAFGSMITDLIRVEKHLKDISLEYSTQIERVRTLTQVSSRYNMSLQTMLGVEKALKDVLIDMSQGKGTREVAALQTMLQALGSKQTLEDFATGDVLDFLRVVKQGTAGMDEMGQRRFARSLTMATGGRVSGESVIREAQNVPSQAQMANQVQAMGWEEFGETKTKLDELYEVLKDIGHHVLIVTQNFTRLAASLGIDKFLGFAAVLGRIIRWFAGVSDRIVSFISSLRQTHAILGTTIDWIVKLGTALFFLAIMTKIQMMFASATGAVGLFGGALGLVVSMIAYSTSPIHRWVWNIMFMIFVVKLARNVIPTLAKAIHFLSEAIFTATTKLTLWLAVIVIIAGVVFQLAGGMDWLSKKMREMVSIDLSGEMAKSTNEFNKLGDAMNSVAEQDIFGGIVEQIIGLPDRVMPPLMELLRGQTKEMQDVFAGSPVMFSGAGNELTINSYVRIEDEFRDALGETSGRIQLRS